MALWFWAQKIHCKWGKDSVKGLLLLVGNAISLYKIYVTVNNFDKNESNFPTHSLPPTFNGNGGRFRGNREEKQNMQSYLKMNLI